MKTPSYFFAGQIAPPNPTRAFRSMRSRASKVSVAQAHPVATAGSVRFVVRRTHTTPSVIAGLLVLMAVCGCKPKTFRQSSGSMEPTINKGEVVLADMAAYSGAAPARWDAVIFNEPKNGLTFISRVVGLPGESIDIKSQGIFINSAHVPLPAHLTNHSYLAAIPGGPPTTVSFPFSIPAHSYFLLGDNTTNAYDSRFMGPLPAANITGRVTRK